MRFSVDSAFDSLHLCYHILLGEGLGSLQKSAEKTRSVWRNQLNSHQEGDSGFFSFDEKQLGSARPTNAPGDLFEQTYLALHSLDALGARAPYPLHFMSRFEDEAALARWLEDPDRSTGSLLQCLLFFTLYQAEVEQRSDAFGRLHLILDWLEGIQDPSSGLWSSAESLTPVEALMATAKIVPYFEYVRRPVSRVTYILDAMLDCQQPDGSLIGVVKDNALADLLLVDLVATLARCTSYQNELIQRLMGASHRSISRVTMQMEEAIAGENGDDAVAAQARWLRRLALATIEAANPALSGNAPQWHFRRWPAPGYHRSFTALSTAERNVLRRWQRPLPQARYDGAAQLDEPRISVVIPCFNLGRYLFEAINSVLKQSLQDLEIIIADDGSDDAFTTFLLSHLQHPLIEVYRQENRGVAAARNFGIRQARAQLICCLDPDDRLRRTFFEKALAILDKRPEVALVSGHIETFDERISLYCDDDVAFPTLLVSNHIVQPAVFRRQAWEQAGGYCETFSSSGIEDWDLWISMLEHGWQAEALGEVVWEYRIRPEQMSTNMFKVETWSRLYRELMLRHEATYREYLPDVVEKQAENWAKTRLWAFEQERGSAWWMRQSREWEQIASRREAYIDELRAWIAELEETKTNLEETKTNLEAKIQFENGKPLLSKIAMLWKTPGKKARTWLHRALRRGEAP